MPKTDSAPWQYQDPILRSWPNHGRVVVFDLEWTAWEGSMQRGWSEDWEHREIVQIGAVLVDALAGFKRIDSFSHFVRPSHNQQLSEYFTILTGIDQTTVDNKGHTFAEAYSKFLLFVDGADILLSNGSDGEVLRENCALNNVDYELKYGKVINIRPKIASVVCDQVGHRNYGFIDSGELPNILGVSSSRGERKHDALSDAEGISLALGELRRRGAI